ncbi:helix-turn-helix domain-containing protein [Castellaniella caeni]|uniref:helix-turn-helix domain-containing protein n=1 Tax=Castellaniella caeni TaxID=266123 RepID=UPI000A033459|nr:helix-turn-helix domain-containing protein [Castellaniella caeni]
MASTNPSGRLADVEAQAIFDSIEKSHHNMAAAARLLGISRSTLYVKWANIRRNNGLE